jgi:hypothetical protein
VADQLDATGQGVLLEAQPVADQAAHARGMFAEAGSHELGRKAAALLESRFPLTTKAKP